MGLDTGIQKEYYYTKRKRFNALKKETGAAHIAEKAALFIYLNKTCFNGLYRVNKRNEFNAAFGSYNNPVICDEENILNANRLLQIVDIRCGDYSECASFIDDKTFVYIDPPYRPIAKNTSSTAFYNKSAFDDLEQMRLAEFIGQIHSKNAKIIISNSDPKNSDTNDNFFDELYRPYNIMRISANRKLNPNSKQRTNVSELLVSNF